MGRNDDNLYHNIRCGNFRMRFCSFGVDTTANCDTYPNLDFISFIWQNLEVFDFVKYAMSLVRRDYLSLPELLCLKQYRAESGGWRNDIHCDECIMRFRSIIQPMRPHPCLRTMGDCRCTLCTRQPPSLLLFNIHLILKVKL
jgi:hypothetical protein